MEKLAVTEEMHLKFLSNPFWTYRAMERVLTEIESDVLVSLFTSVDPKYSINTAYAMEHIACEGTNLVMNVDLRTKLALEIFESICQLGSRDEQYEWFRCVRAKNVKPDSSFRTPFNKNTWTGGDAMIFLALNYSNMIINLAKELVNENTVHWDARLQAPYLMKDRQLTVFKDRQHNPMLTVSDKTVPDWWTNNGVPLNLESSGWDWHTQSPINLSATNKEMITDKWKQAAAAVKYTRSNSAWTVPSEGN